MQIAYLMPVKKRMNLKRHSQDDSLFVRIHPQVYDYTLFVGQAVQIQVSFNGDFLRRKADPAGIVQLDKITLDADRILNYRAEKLKLQRDLGIMFEKSQKLKEVNKLLAKEIAEMKRVAKARKRL